MLWPDPLPAAQPRWSGGSTNPSTRGWYVTDRPTAAQLLDTPGALLSRTDLRQLGLDRRAVDAVFRNCPVILLPGYNRPLVRAEAYKALLEGATYCDRCGDRVRPPR
jgi:hypothetical protein